MIASPANGRPFASTFFQFLGTSFSRGAPNFCFSLCLYLVNIEAIIKNKTKIKNQETSPKNKIVKPIGIAVKIPDLFITFVLKAKKDIAIIREIHIRECSIVSIVDARLVNMIKWSSQDYNTVTRNPSNINCFAVLQNSADK